MTTPFQVTQSYLFTPLSLSNCVLWLDASDPSTLFQDTAGTNPISANGQTVALWKDKSTSANNASNATSPPTIITASQNNKNVLSFNGSSQYLSLDIAKMPTGATPFSFFILTKTPSSGVNVFLTWGDQTSTGNCPQLYFDTYTLKADLYGSTGPTTTASFNNTYVVNTITASTTKYNGWGNGTPFTTTNVTITLNVGTTFARIGARLNGNAISGYFNGQIAEIVGYNRVVDDTERQQIEAYLMWKWGLQGNIPATNPNQVSPVYSLAPTPIVAKVPYSTNAPVFVPTQISGCQLWFDASDPRTIGLSGTNITQWNDKSANKYAVYQTTVGSQPTISYASQNGLNGIQFATSTYLSNLATSMANFTTGSATSVFIAARNASTNIGWNIINTIWFIAAGDGGTQRYHFSFNQDTTDGTTLYTNGVLVGQVTSNAVAGGSNAILGFTASATSQTIHTNGSSDTYAGVSLPNAAGNTLFIFNDNRNISAASSNTMIFEMVGYNKQLSNPERQQVEGYLAWKWGLTSLLPSDNPYKSPPLAAFSYPALPRVLTNQLWSPLTLTGYTCATWLDASDLSTITFVGSKVSKWGDKSTSSPKRDASATTATNYPNYQNKSVYFPPYNAGVQDAQLIFSNNITSCTGYSMFVVTKPSTSTSNYKTLIKGSLQHIILTNTGTANVGAFDGSFKQFGSITMDGTARVMMYLQIDSSNFFSASLNGTISLTTPVSVTPDSILTFGNASAGQAQPWGEVNEFIVYTTNLQTSDRQTVEGYLAWKWGIQSSLPASHPYKNWPPSP